MYSTFARNSFKYRAYLEGTRGLESIQFQIDGFANQLGEGLGMNQRCLGKEILGSLG